MIGTEERPRVGFSLVGHPMPPRALAAPLHKHSREDEYSYVLEGRMGALLGDDVVTYVGLTQADRARPASAMEACRVNSSGHAYTIVYAPGMAKTVASREFRANLSALLAEVADRREHVVVTRNGRPAAALVPIDEYEALEETAELLSDAGAVSAIEVGLAEIERGETVPLDDVVTEMRRRRD